jgi:hypothetical protein
MCAYARKPRLPNEQLRCIPRNNDFAAVRPFGRQHLVVLVALALALALLVALLLLLLIVILLQLLVVHLSLPLPARLRARQSGPSCDRIAHRSAASLLI